MWPLCRLGPNPGVNHPWDTYRWALRREWHLDMCMKCEQLDTDPSDDAVVEVLQLAAGIMGATGG
jgi:hypothetical protein